MLCVVCRMSCDVAWYDVQVTSEAYSSPSIVLAAKSGDGGKIIFDDFRESYYWLRQNTARDAKIMSWWDYGYQITAMANRTILVDNNTWNNTHIATVGRMMASNESVAYPIMRSLDVDYILVIFGGLTGYSSDDINKFLWMVRIGGGVFPEIKEKDYMATNGEFRVDRAASKTMLNSLMYKLCYYRFGQVHTEQNKPSGWDRVRGVEIGNKEFELEHVDEAFTSEHWIVRIYKVRRSVHLLCSIRADCPSCCRAVLSMNRSNRMTTDRKRSVFRLICDCFYLLCCFSFVYTAAAQRVSVFVIRGPCVLHPPLQLPAATARQ